MKNISKVIVLVIGWGLNAIALTDEGVNTTDSKKEQAVKAQQARADKMTSVALNEVRSLMAVLLEAAKANQLVFDNAKDIFSNDLYWLSRQHEFLKRGLSFDEIDSKYRRYVGIYYNNHQSLAEQIDRTVDLLEELVPQKRLELSSKTSIVDVVESMIKKFERDKNIFLPGLDEGGERIKNSLMGSLYNWMRSGVVHNCHERSLEKVTSVLENDKQSGEILPSLLKEVEVQQLNAARQIEFAKGSINTVLYLLDKAIVENQKLADKFEEYDVNVRLLKLISTIILDATETKDIFDVQLHCPKIDEEVLQIYSSSKPNWYERKTLMYGTVAGVVTTVALIMGRTRNSMNKRCGCGCVRCSL